MVYKEENLDLFSVSNDYYLAHCISSDYALGAGIAVEFNKRFDMRRKLNEKMPNCWTFMKKHNIDGFCITVDYVLNLVTKERYWHKPTYKSIEDALKSMRQACKSYGIKKVAMPMIGCGLDRLQWYKVSEIINKTFENEDIEILVCIK